MGDKDLRQMTALLETTDLTVQFGGLKACNEISLDVNRGELLGLIGPNGAGKTTFINAITGFVPSTGQVLFDRGSIGGLPPHRIAHRCVGFPPAHSRCPV